MLGVGLRGSRVERKPNAGGSGRCCPARSYPMSGATSLQVYPEEMSIPGVGMADALAGGGRSAQQRIKVLLINSHRLFGEALCTVLRVDPSLDVLDLQEDALHAEPYVRTARPDVVVLECLFPETRAAQSIAMLMMALPGLKILVLTAVVDIDTLAACVQAGASGHLTRDCTIWQLIDAIKRAHVGEMLFSPEALISLLTGPKRHERAHTLTAREHEVLQAMADGLTVAETAERMAIAVDTVRTHIRNCMGKLGARSRLEAVLIGLRAGIIELRTPDVSAISHISGSRAQPLVY